MSVARLSRILDELPKALAEGVQARLQHLETKVANERPSADFGPIIHGDFEEHLDCQRARLLEVEDWIRAAAEQVLDDYPVSIFLTGSLARLEYLPGASDIDLLGIVTGDGRDPAYLEADRVADLEAAINERISAEGALIAETSISGIPITSPDPHKPGDTRRAKTFYHERELIDCVGKEYEAPWAGFERGSLIFESASAYGDASADDIRCAIDGNLYKIAADLSNKKFPVVGYCFVQYLAKSSLLAKAAGIHAKLDRADYVSKETAKVMLARISNSYVNLIALHVIYWNILLGELRVSPSKILEELRAPPIWKALRTIPWHMRFIRETEVWKVQLSYILSEEDMTPVEDLLVDVFHHLGHGGSDTQVPLWYRFSQLMKLCHSLREERFNLTGEVVSKLKKWSLDMDALLSKCSRITCALSITNMPDRDGLAILHDLISHTLHGAASELNGSHANSART